MIDAIDDTAFRLRNDFSLSLLRAWNIFKSIDK